MVESQKNTSKNMGNHICLVQSQKDSDYCKLAKAIDIIIYCGLSLSARIVYYQIVVKDVQKKETLAYCCWKCKLVQPLWIIRKTVLL